ncbi:MAG: FAD-dependent oxidoreductase, partial [Psychromonas sp.]|nr:FAD-dependent oxidoreductase [Psychromonas sp.]
IVICTGAKPFIPDIPGLNDVNFVTSDTIWDIEVLPKKLLVLGAGPIGCELAQSFQRLGSQVIIVEAAPQILFREDPDTAKVIEKQFVKEGIKILVSHTVIGFSVKQEQSQAELLCNDNSVFEQFDTVLIATGRKANVTGFGLQTLGIELSERGTIVVNEYMQTKYKNIFAVGDVTGPFQLTHAAAHQAWYAAVNGLFGRFKRFKVDYSVLPSVTYSDPEVARVGINEQQAKLENIAIDVYQYQLDDLDRAIADGQDTGFVKVLTAKGSDKILGATIVSNHASDMLAEFTLAMRYKIGLNKILSTIHPYPTMSEANKYVAGLWKKDNAPQKLLTLLEKYHHWTRTKGDS